MESSIIEQCFLMFLFFMSGFVFSVFLVIPFGLFSNIRSFAATGAADIRGS